MLFQGGALLNCGSRSMRECRAPAQGEDEAPGDVIDEIGADEARTREPREVRPPHTAGAVGGMKKRAALARAMALEPRSCSATSRARASIRSPRLRSISLILDSKIAFPDVPLVVVTHELAKSRPSPTR